MKKMYHAVVRENKSKDVLILEFEQNSKMEFWRDCRDNGYTLQGKISDDVEWRARMERE